MLSLLRVALQLVLFSLLLGAVIGIAAADTGALEKLVLAALAGVIVWLAKHVRRIGAAAGNPRPI